MPEPERPKYLEVSREREEWQAVKSWRLTEQGSGWMLWTLVKTLEVILTEMETDKGFSAGHGMI